MKKSFKIVLLAAAAASLLSLSQARAAEHAFNFSIGANSTLVINAPDGTQVATLPTATVGKTVTSGAYSFQVSYGQDANGNLSLIVTPDPDHPNAVSFNMDGRDISMDRTSAVTLTLTNGGRDVVVDPGYTGAVKVNGQSVTTPVATTTTANGTVVVPLNSPNGGGTVNTSTTTTTTTTTTTASNGTTPAQVPGTTAQQPDQNTGTPIGSTTGGPGLGDPNTFSDITTTMPTQVTFNSSATAQINPQTNPNPTSPSASDAGGV